MKRIIVMCVAAVFMLVGLASFAQDNGKVAEMSDNGAELNINPVVQLGVETLLKEQIDLVKGKRVGLITNLTGVDGHLRATVDLLHENPDVQLTALFGPEHGIRGGVQGAVDNSTDTKTMVPVFSLYGKTREPSEEMLKNVDVLVFDIQDIGSRSYTFISTMYVCMEAAAKFDKKFIVLDRPNPINGLVVDGNVLDMKFKSFIGIGPIAYVHGMTVGELALFFNTEMNINCDLTVVQMKGWTRDMTWADTGLLWVPTSPHIPEPDSALYYPVTGIVGELPLINIGVGYTLPFKLIGAPWMDGQKVAAYLNAQELPGVYFRPFYYRPYYFYFAKEDLSGVRIIITDHKTFQPAAIDYHIMAALVKFYPAEFDLNGEQAKPRHGMFDKANGTDKMRNELANGVSGKEIVNGYQKELSEFKKVRAKYLIYE
jgi:uncharacterized protein YbbC (DUF1343 family)